MAKVLEVSKSGFYAWLLRPESARKRARRLLDARVRAAFEAHKARYGSTKIARYLTGQGHPCSRTRVAQSMRRQGLRSKVARKFRATTDSNHHLAAAPNLLDRNFDIDAPNRVWASDITYLPSKAGWLYLAVFIDLFSRRIVGWCVSTSLRHEMVLKALSRAIRARRPPKGLMIHSDRGIQYCCEGFREKIAEYGFVQSMSRKGNCWDNAVSESLFRSLKTRVGLPHRPGRPRARRARTLRIHRGLLQQPAVARVFGLRISSRLRTPKSGLVHRPLFQGHITLYGYLEKAMFLVSGLHPFTIGIRFFDICQSEKGLCEFVPNTASYDIVSGFPHGAY